MDIEQLQAILSRASKGPWRLQDEPNNEVAVVNDGGGDVSGPAPRGEALNDYTLIVELRNYLPTLIEQNIHYLAMLLDNRICLDCGKKMNRQLYCVKCGIEWDTDEA